MEEQTGTLTHAPEKHEGCYEVKSYHIGRPMPPAHFRRWYQNRDSLRPSAGSHEFSITPDE